MPSSHEVGVVLLVVFMLVLVGYGSMTKSSRILRAARYYSLIFLSIFWYYLNQNISISSTIYSAVRVLLLLLGGFAIYRVYQIIWRGDRRLPN